MNRKLGWLPDIPDERDIILKVRKPKDFARLYDIRWRGTMPPVRDQGNVGSCHDEETEVLTINGWKLFKDVLETDQLATVCPNTHVLIYEKPERLIKFAFDGNMISVNHKSLNFMVTEDHKMLVRKWNEKKRTLNDQYEFVDAKNLGWYSGLLNEVKFHGIKDSSEYIFKPIDHKWINSRNGLVLSMKYWLYFLGIYLSDGSLCKEDYKIQIACTKKRKKLFIKNVLANFGLSCLELKDRITFCNKQIWKEIEEYGLLGIKAPDKFVPKFIFQLSSDNISEFIFGFLNGDGSISGKRKTYHTSSKQLAIDIQLLLFLSGKSSNISIRKEGRISELKGRKINSVYPEYCVIEHQTNNLSIETKQKIQVPYSGFVYCAEVKTYHTLVTRRKNYILISGNCTGFGVGTGAWSGMLSDTTFSTPAFHPSELFIYYNGRSNKNEDSGASIRDVVKGTVTYGVAPFSTWLNKSYNVCKKPTAKAYNEAIKFKTIRYARVKQTKDDICNVIASGYPIIFGHLCYTNFFAVDKNGIVPMPKGRIEGGHCEVMCGYNLDKGLILVQNSWGLSRGLRGYEYFPIEYILDKEITMDLWTIYEVSI